MPKPTEFEFVSHAINPQKGELLFNYAVNFENGAPLTFTEKLVLPPGHRTGQTIDELLARILPSLHLILGISYYKLYAPAKFKHPYKLTEEQVKFWNTVYKKGLGEFLYRNSLDPEKLAQFTANSPEEAQSVSCAVSDRILSAIGGGKDSIVSTELLKEGGFEVTTLYTQTQKPNEQVRRLLTAFQLPNLTVERYLDPKIFQQYEGGYNGHVPVSAILAFIGILMGVLYDYKYIAVANEWSSNFGNLEYKGLTVNHQWSKSQEFEELFQDYVRRHITPSVVYFSLLRHSNELRIAKLFSRYKKYFPLFSSCNRVAKISQETSSKLWCGECAKCAFAYAILSPFLSKKTLIGIFGSDLLANKNLEQTFKDISGQGGMKPFDCVGTFEEVTAALSKNKKLLQKELQTHPALLIPAQFAFLGMNKAVIIGLGKEGKVTKAFLKKHYPKLKIGVSDQKQGKDYLKKQFNYDVAIKTPSLPRRHVEIFYTTATNIFFSRAPRAQIIGVTGSKGKSTTASLIAHVLRTAGRKVELLGNIGEPMLSVLDKKIDPETILVLELSSYQLEDLRQSPHIAVVTSLFPEHMDYHGSTEEYYKAKANIWKFQTSEDYLVMDVGKASNDPRREWLQETMSRVASPKPQINQALETKLRGAHNMENIALAMAVCEELRISSDAFNSALKTFEPLKHRFEEVGTFKGITFIDDAISTTPESTIAAIKSAKRVKTIFLGGSDRGYDFTELEAKLRSFEIKNIVLFPESGERMIKDPTGFTILRTKSMKEAVKFAYENTPSGSTCLLSTASPSYSLWKDFTEKGTEYQKFVRKFGKSQ